MTRIVTTLIPIIAALIVFHCKSTPKIEEKPPEPPPVVIPEPVVEKRAAPEPKEEEMEVAVRPSLNLRNAPGLRGRILESIPYGQKVVILDRLDDESEGKKSKNKWYKVKYDGETGYVNAKYLREAGDDIIVKAPAKRARKRRKVRKAAAKKMTPLAPETVEPTQKKKP
ncbi:MAG: SH3 domain-containing protein [Spirochaetes bacterium]|nr:SH3 domain-containing protein [Spirochaetota bacterium]